MKEEDSSTELNAGIPDGLGQCYHALREFDKAISYYDTAIEMMPESTEFLMHRAQCQYDQGHFDFSITDLKKGLKEDGNGRNNPQVLYKLGLSFYANCQYKKCVSTLK